jgi:hypothetical protein
MPGADCRRFVGRTHQIDRLRNLWSLVQERARQIVFVTGEIGIGKTQLVRLFIDQLGDAAWIVEGHCVEQYGAGEAYLPLIEGLARLRRQTEARSARRVERHAPIGLHLLTRDVARRRRTPAHRHGWLATDRRTRTPVADRPVVVFSTICTGATGRRQSSSSDGTPG